MKFLPNQDLLDAGQVSCKIGETYGIKFRRFPYLGISRYTMFSIFWQYFSSLPKLAIEPRQIWFLPGIRDVRFGSRYFFLILLGSSQFSWSFGTNLK